MIKPIKYGLLMTAVLTLSACGEKDGGAGGATSRAVAVRTAVVTTADVSSKLESVGRLVSRNAPTLAAEVNARVVEILADEGRPVEKGQVLLRLDNTTFELARAEAQAAIQGLEVSIANESRRVERYRNLSKTDALSRERLDDAEAQLASSRAAKVAAEARLAIAEDRLSKTELVSPVSGVIERRHVSVGDYVRPADPLMSLTDTKALRAELPFPETVAHALRPGATTVLESLAAPGLTIEASIEHLRPQVGGMNRALVAIVDLENPGPWLPQATVHATVVTERRPGATVVPVNAVVDRPAGKVVFRYEAASGTVKQQVVEPGQRQNGWTEILSGVRAGDVVVSDGASYLTEGAAVTVRDGEP